jgi:hypothetical protein
LIDALDVTRQGTRVSTVLTHLSATTVMSQGICLQIAQVLKRTKVCSSVGMGCLDSFSTAYMFPLRKKKWPIVPSQL